MKVQIAPLVHVGFGIMKFSKNVSWMREEIKKFFIRKQIKKPCLWSVLGMFFSIYLTVVHSLNTMEEQFRKYHPQFALSSLFSKK